MRDSASLRGSLTGTALVTLTAAALVSCSQSEEDHCQTSGEETCVELAPNEVQPVQVSPFARLTHPQWENTVADLLGTTALPDFSANFRSDPNQQGFLFDNDVNSLAVDQALWQGYQDAAAQIAGLVVADPVLLARMAAAGTPQAEGTEARGRSFIEAFGMRVHRRPLSQQQVEDYLALYGRGAEIFPELGAFEAGIRLLLQAFLQSPHFLYRIEGSTAAQGSVVPLDDYEVAARLSYALWDTMPDESLFQAAATGELRTSDAVAEYARRMLNSERAAPVLARLHYRLFDVERYRGISRYPEETLPALAEQEHRRFVQHVAFQSDGSLADLFTSTQSFVNAKLADLYGVSGEFSDEFQLVELDPAQRSGFLTQIGFLASNANSGVPDPIHRGVFLARRIACINLPMPPNDIPPLPPAEGRTNRERVAAHTEAAGSVCSGCHGPIINPFGFPFEYYDGLGRFRTEDNGQPVDGTTTPALEGRPTVHNAVELAHALAESQQVHDCYAKHLLEFTFGRVSAAADSGILERVALSSKDDVSVKELLVHLVSSSTFLTRSQKEP